MKSRILIVDDDSTVRQVVRTLMLKEGYEVTEAEDAANLRSIMHHIPPDLVLLDLQLPDADGLALLPYIKKQWPDTEVIMLTGHGTIENAVAATKEGAYQFLSKPFEPKTLILHAQRALEHKQLTEQTSSLRQALSAMSSGASPIFKSPAMKKVVHTVERVAPSDVSILITGESGVGKEVIADLLHTLSPRSHGPLIKVNCAALPRELIESELFGSVRGAYTGAHADREGLFLQAQGGTLMLDELSEMPIDTQSKLLRVLQEKNVRPVGGKSSFTTDCRIIAATNRKTDEAIKEGKLREDLYYRISAITVDIPPLRERREDIIPLANAFLHRFSAQAGQTMQGFTDPASRLLEQYDWPGNVRQLQNEIQRVVLMTDGPMIDVRDLSLASETSESNQPNLNLLEGMERTTIIQVLKETGGNKVETAKRLGIGRQTLYNKIKLYKIDA